MGTDLRAALAEGIAEHLKVDKLRVVCGKDGDGSWCDYSSHVEPGDHHQIRVASTYGTMTFLVYSHVLVAFFTGYGAWMLGPIRVSWEDEAGLDRVLGMGLALRGRESTAEVWRELRAY